MNIKKFSEQVGVSAHTIRYYEKIGLLKNVRRNVSGHRDFSQTDIEWLTFIKRLKDTGMPLDTINVYADLRHQGNSTSVHRMSLLEEHAVCLKNKIEVELLNLKKLEEKIEHYKEVIKGDVTA
jgi:DNA-binding transcriptional MerR regulator